MFQTVLAEIIKSGILSGGNKNCIGENGNYIEYYMNKTCIPILILHRIFRNFYSRVVFLFSLSIFVNLFYARYETFVKLLRITRIKMSDNFS